MRRCYVMRPRLKHIGIIITFLLIILLLMNNFAMSKDYKKVLRDLQNCPCEEGEFCHDGTCTAASLNNDSTITWLEIGNEAGIPLNVTVGEDNVNELRNCVKNCTEIQNCIKICLPRPWS
jgi:hypothetical protein